MNLYACKQMTVRWGLAATAALSGCAGLNGGDAGGPSRYRCDQGVQFNVRFVNDTALLQGARGDDVLLRDAGGQGTQTVYTNARVRAEFGLGATGREAVLHYLQPPLTARCLRE